MNCGNIVNDPEGTNRMILICDRNFILSNIQVLNIYFQLSIINENKNNSFIELRKFFFYYNISEWVSNPRNKFHFVLQKKFILHILL